ncbi:MAG: lysoplasmalogenase [Chloroflexota bacterium]
MTSLELVLLAAAGVVAATDWFFVARGDARHERIAKPAVIVILLLPALFGDPEARPMSLLLAAALGASFFGDILLLPPVRFSAGLAAFLLAHVAYLAAFLLGPLHAPAAAVGAVVGVVLLVLVGRPILSGASAAGMRRPVAAYFGAIVLMAIAATASGSWVAAAGAWLFVTSDAVLGWRQFVGSPEARHDAPAWHRLGVMVPYHLGQILLTAAILIQRAS